MQKVVQLLYFREVSVPVDLKTKMDEALRFLKIDDINKDSESEQPKQFIAPSNGKFFFIVHFSMCVISKCCIFFTLNY